MIRILSLLVLITGLTVAKAQVADQHIQLAEEFLSNLQKRDFKRAFNQFDEIVGGQVSTGKLGEIWYSLNVQAGSYQEHYNTRTEEVYEYDIVYLSCHFKNMDLDIKVVFNKDLQIAGFFFIPVKPLETYQPPPYDNPEKYQVEDVELATGIYHLPGKLTLPKNSQSFPLVILVHGSGPNDMDETIGPNKIFRDLASGLANNGIATLRYDKRTKVYGAQMDISSLTVFEETIEDALTAIRMVRENKNVSSVVILGHSLGAFVAPRIAGQDHPPDGIILMAGNSRPLEDLVLDQVTYLYSADGLTMEEEEMIRELKGKIKMIKENTITEKTPSKDLILDLPPSYWLDLRAYNPVETLRQLTLPALILQGERDYQVTMEDFRIWKEKVGEMENVRMISYPGLNHLFIEGKEISLPSEYSKPGNIPNYVIEDISEWIKRFCQ